MRGGLGKTNSPEAAGERGEGAEERTGTWPGSDSPIPITASFSSEDASLF